MSPTRRTPYSIKAVAGLLALAICLAGCTASNSKKSSSNPSGASSASASKTNAAANLPVTKSATPGKASTPKSLSFEKVTKADALKLEKLVVAMHAVQSVVYYPKTTQFEVFLKSATAADIASIKAAVRHKMTKK